MYKLTTDERSSSAKLVDVETGAEVRSISSLDLHLRIDEVTRATVQLVAVGCDADIGDARFVIGDPLDGEMRRVKRVEYEDGTGFEVVGGRLMRFGGADG